ncbi:Asparagine synthetase [glutamine-hydrolyzing] 1 [Fundidesulfovibrio magnetotacticus]|uniref:asparagine synthase (glutamine-hydrolyzing) n=1 Tax=Fundidesulfovibrio magnetotacticus TaxID=2730080 RepID=A0A6V8LW62_9BACT|nr:asparagine synthase (glutamine-hydrolyzing) [Fundidesulfovibrio magnetotacticus]GFK95974.1 Asparagine synthetase [glutamine-hydrolyzing] 1 [Fundidesulfovibrio magnetotacticus]
MCGIAGLVDSLGRPLPPEAMESLQAMTASMAHRGPDGCGHWRDGPAALGHRRLSIIDLSTGAQPMEDAHGRLAVTFNGEIYNYREIRAALEALGHAFRTCSDTEVILAGWLQWGPRCLERFEGMFAFALWDRRERTLFCARDRFGKKPFFYTLQNGLFAFASESSALRRVPGLRLDVEAATLARFLAYEYVPSPESIYRQVKKLPPSHWLELREGRVTLGRYWSLPAPEPARASEAELGRELERLMAQAVKRRMISDVPLGVFLSGGIDSSLVAALMAGQAPRIKTFSIGFREASYDESAYARSVARMWDTEHHEHILSAEDCAGLLPEIVTRFDEPMADPSIAPTYLLSKVTRQEVTVALGGDGADELFAGYEHFQGFQAARLYNALPRPVRRFVVDPACAALPASDGYVNLRLGAATFLHGARQAPWLRVQDWLTALHPELQRQLWRDPAPLGLDAPQLFASTRRTFDRSSASADLDRLFHAYCRQYLLDYILVKVDRCTMMHSLEARAPFLDRDVAEFACRLPTHMKLRGLSRKYLLKKALAHLLPEEIRTRNKRGFLIPVARWLRDKLKPLVEELLGEDHLRRQGLFDPKTVRGLVHEHDSGRRDRRKELWTLLVLQLWLAHNKPDVS